MLLPVTDSLDSVFGCRSTNSLCFEQVKFFSEFALVFCSGTDFQFQKQPVIILLNVLVEHLVDRANLFRAL